MKPSGFDEAGRNLVLAADSHFDRWLSAVTLAFRSKYKVPRAPLGADVLPHSAATRLQTIVETLEQDLRPVIETRNKLAHGQWHYPLNEQGTDVVEHLMATLQRENILSLSYEHQLLEHIAALVHDLVVSPIAFERDFDLHFSRIVSTRRDLQKRDYRAWRMGLRNRFKRARRELD
jgi:hypothetical protein